MKYSWKVDDFDSGIFGFKAAKIVELGSKEVKNLIGDLIKNKVSYATVRVQSNDFPLIHALESAGFVLVDGLISLSFDLDSVKLKIESEIREAKDKDLQQLKKLTTNLYSGTRITNDPLTRARANNYYVKWIENSVKGEVADSVLIWKEGNEILGYVTLQKKGSEGQIPLIGVSAKARGKGIASSLLNAALAKFKKWGVKKVNIDTQIGNIPALRAYQGVGFKIVDSHLTFRWDS